MQESNSLLQHRYEGLVKCMAKHGLIAYEDRLKRGLPARQMLGVTIMKQGVPHWIVRIYGKDGKYHIQLRPADRE